MIVIGYVLLEDTTYKGDHESNIISQSFYGSYRKAKEEFDKRVVETKKSDSDFLNCESDCIIDEEDEFTFWEDGNFLENHYSLRLIELTVV